MPTYERKHLDVQRVEFHVPAPAPWGAPYVEVMKAVHAAVTELREAGTVGEFAEPADDALAIAPHDDHIVVSYEVRRRG